MNKVKNIQRCCIGLLFFVAGICYLLFGGAPSTTAKETQNSLTTINTDSKTEDSLSDTKSRTSEVVRSEKDEIPPIEIKQIVVHVCGNVKNPGVYILNEGTRVVDAVQNAGGFTAQAAVDWLNQALLLSDGQKVYIPSKEEVQVGKAELITQNQPASVNLGKVNLNVATKEELMSLPGIGEAKADLMIAYREEHNGFKSIEDILEITGIKEAVYTRVKDRVTVK